MKFRRITGLTFRCEGAKQSFCRRIKVLTVFSDSRLTKIARAVRSLIAAARSAFCVKFLLLLQRAVQTTCNDVGAAVQLIWFVDPPLRLHACLVWCSVRYRKRQRLAPSYLNFYLSDEVKGRALGTPLKYPHSRKRILSPTCSFKLKPVGCEVGPISPRA